MEIDTTTLIHNNFEKYEIKKLICNFFRMTHIEFVRDFSTSSGGHYSAKIIQYISTVMSIERMSSLENSTETFFVNFTLFLFKKKSYLDKTKVPYVRMYKTVLPKVFSRKYVFTCTVRYLHRCQIDKIYSKFTVE